MKPHAHYDQNSLKAPATLGDVLELGERILFAVRSNHDSLGHALSILECHIMSLLTDLQTELGRINAATTDIAADIDTLIEKLGTAPTPAEVAEVKAALATISDTLEATAAKYPTTPPAP